MRIRKVDRVVTDTHYYCDTCDKKAQNIRKCKGCQVEICEKCEITSNYCYWTNEIEDDTAYMSVFCKNCKKELDKIIPSFKVEHERHDAELEKLEKEFFKKCKNAKNNSK